MHTPDLFDGRTFDALDEGIAYAAEVGFGEVIERGAGAAEGLPTELVYAGFSLGVMPAQKLAQTRPGAAGRCCSTSCVAGRRSSGRRGRRACRCRSTAWTPTRSSSTRATSTPPASSSRRPTEAELFLYPGDQHLFADASLPSYDADAAALLTDAGARVPRRPLTGPWPRRRAQP